MEIWESCCMNQSPTTENKILAINNVDGLCTGNWTHRWWKWQRGHVVERKAAEILTGRGPPLSLGGTEEGGIATRVCTIRKQDVPVCWETTLHIRHSSCETHSLRQKEKESSVLAFLFSCLVVYFWCFCCPNLEDHWNSCLGHTARIAGSEQGNSRSKLC